MRHILLALALLVATPARAQQLPPMRVQCGATTYATRFKIKLVSGATCADNSSNRSTDVTITGGGGTVTADSPLTGDGSSGSHLACATCADLATAQALSNKTLTAPVINGATSASGNFDLSGSSGTTKTTGGAVTIGPGAVTLSGDMTTNGFVKPNYGGTAANVSAATWTAVAGSCGSAPCLKNSWANFGTSGGNADASYYKDSASNVHLRGWIASGAGSTVAFTMPAGFRPAAQYQLIIGCNNVAFGFVQVNTNGDIAIFNGSGFAQCTGLTILDGVVYQASQ